MKTLDLVALVLLIVGGLNWGVLGLSGANVVMTVFGAWPMLVTLIYLLVGLSALYVGWMTFTKKGM
jgi:hypothetical protein